MAKGLLRGWQRWNFLGNASRSGFLPWAQVLLLVRLVSAAASMQEVLFEGGGLETGAIFSDCERWRYVLWRVWNWQLRLLLSISLNPSKADAFRNDNTVSKMMRYARLWGFGGLIKLNAYGWRATSPAEMKSHGVEAIGDLNDFWIQQVWKVFGPEGRDQIGLSVGSWGQHDFLNRGPLIREYIPNLHHLGLNQNGSPTHPLYLPMTIKPMPFN
jgi:hypothetical protein